MADYQELYGVNVADRTKKIDESDWVGGLLIKRNKLQKTITRMYDKLGIIGKIPSLDELSKLSEEYYEVISEFEGDYIEDNDEYMGKMNNIITFCQSYFNIKQLTSKGVTKGSLELCKMALEDLKSLGSVFPATIIHVTDLCVMIAGANPDEIESNGQSIIKSSIVNNDGAIGGSQSCELSSIGQNNIGSTKIIIDDKLGGKHLIQESSIGQANRIETTGVKFGIETAPSVSALSSVKFQPVIVQSSSVNTTICEVTKSCENDINKNLTSDVSNRLNNDVNKNLNSELNKHLNCDVIKQSNSDINKHLNSDLKTCDLSTVNSTNLVNNCASQQTTTSSKGVYSGKAVIENQYDVNDRVRANYIETFRDNGFEGQRALINGDNSIYSNGESKSIGSQESGLMAHSKGITMGSCFEDVELGVKFIISKSDQNINAGYNIGEKRETGRTSYEDDSEAGKGASWEQVNRNLGYNRQVNQPVNRGNKDQQSTATTSMNLSSEITASSTLFQLVNMTSTPSSINSEIRDQLNSVIKQPSNCEMSQQLNK